jgi:hypothetical protein
MVTLENRQISGLISKRTVLRIVYSLQHLNRLRRFTINVVDHEVRSTASGNMEQTIPGLLGTIIVFPFF